MTFANIWQITDSIPGSFTRLSAEHLYRHASEVPDEGLIVEVGVDQGRSASLLLHAALKPWATVVLVDSWESVLVDNYAKVTSLVEQFESPSVVIHGFSVPASKLVTQEIDLIHIDANHHAPNPGQDCEAWLPKLRSGGVAFFHDYEAPGFDVTAAVDEYTSGWEDLGVWDSLAIRRKP